MQAVEALLQFVGCAVLLDQEVRVGPHHLGVGAQERLDEGRPRQEAPLLVLERPKVLGTDLRTLLDIRDAELLARARRV